MLEQFAPATKPVNASATKAAALTTAPSGPTTNGASGSSAGAEKQLPPGLEDLDINNDFARELAEGMAALMREIAVESGDKPEENLTGTDAPSTQEQLEREAEFRKAWEEMLVEGMNGALDTSDFGVNKKGKAAAKPGELDGPKADVNDDGFQASIRKAMDKLKESDATLHVRHFLFFERLLTTTRSRQIQRLGRTHSRRSFHNLEMAVVNLRKSCTAYSKI